MVIREPRRSDFDDLVKMYFSFFPEVNADPSFGLHLYRKRPNMKKQRKWFSGFMKDIKAGRVLACVAEVDSKVIGWCTVNTLVPGSPVDHRASLGISVMKEFRGCGIGTSLLKATLKACRGKFEIIELDVFSNNKRAIRLYRRFGFTRYGHLPSATKRAGRYFDQDLMYLKL